MKESLKIVFACCMLFAGLMTNKALAISAYPHPVQIKQPDGTTITVILKGDEKVKWAQTLDGYTILRNSKGVFEYAMQNANGDIKPSGIAARDISSRKSDELNFLVKTPKGLHYSKSQVSLMKSIYEVKSAESQKVFPTTGARKLICILMGFTDKSFTKTQAEFNNLFNQVGYTTGGATGSVKDFYNESSYNQFNLTVTVAGPYTAANNMGYYGGNDASGNDLNPRALVSEAINAADASVNFADFDNDGDGTVDGIYVIFAGYGEEAGASANCIWSHAWSLASPVTKDGKTISKYSCSPELRGVSGTTITAIGVICHEFGHVLGSPDYYDTDYSTGGQFDGTGNWDLMAGGSWNNNGVTPAQHNAYTKVKVYNWATATVLSTASTVTVTHAEANKSFYQINSTTANEYWILENRQQVGFDANLPGHGLIIYHVHSGIGTYSINTTYPQKMYPVCANATTNPGTTAATYGTINGAGCPFPGSGGKTSFGDATTPNMKSWAGANTAKPITNIVENTTTKTITFSFMVSPYCASNGTNQVDEWIDLVQFAGINRTSGAETGGYKDNTNMVGTVTRGATIPIYYSAGYSGTVYVEYWGVWIDFNQNGVFDATEKVVSRSASSAATLTSNITIPSTALLGNTRMRVSMSYGSYAAACGTFTYGEVEDYTVNITATALAAKKQTTIAENVEEFTIFPNPTSERLTVQFKQIESSATLKIYDIRGCLVKTVIVNESTKDIDVSELSKGIYMIKIEGIGKFENKKFIKE